MHGYNHIYHKCNRHDLIFPFYDRSEFCGLTLDEQIEKSKMQIRYSFQTI